MKPVQIAVCICMVLSVTPILGAQGTAATSQQQIEAHARQAAEYLKQNRPDLAVPEFKAIVGLDPENVDARGNLGVLLFFQGKYADAIPQLRAALKLKPELWKIQALLGIGEKRTGDIDQARRDLEQAFPKLSDQKIQVETGMELIDIYTTAGDLDKAAPTISVLRHLEPTNEVILYSAYRLYSDLASESLLSLSVVAPNSARMHQAMAHELAKQGNNAAAIENYRTALKLDPDLNGVHFELAEMLNLSTSPADREEAKSEYKKALEVDPSDEQSECRLGDIALRRNDLKEADDRYRKAVQLRPDDPDANLGLAKVLMAMGQPEKAEPLLDRAIQLDPTSAVAHFRLSTIYREQGRINDAKREIAQYEKYKAMKDKLRDLYQAMRLAPAGQEQGEPDPRQ